MPCLGLFSLVPTFCSSKFLTTLLLLFWCLLLPLVSFSLFIKKVIKSHHGSYFFIAMSINFISCLHLTIVGVVPTCGNYTFLLFLVCFGLMMDTGGSPQIRCMTACNPWHRYCVQIDTDTVSKLTICCPYSYNGSNKYSRHVLDILNILKQTFL